MNIDIENYKALQEIAPFEAFKLADVDDEHSYCFKEWYRFDEDFELQYLTKGGWKSSGSGLLPDILTGTIKIEKTNRLVDDIEIKVGDYVRVIDTGYAYTTYTEFFIDNDIVKLGLKYHYGTIPEYNKEIYKVVYIAPHEYQPEVSICAIQNMDSIGQIYLMDIDGLVKTDI